MSHKEYIGDGVYVEHDGFGIVLTTEDGISTTNRIVLEPQVLKAMQDWLGRLSDELDAEAKQERGNHG